MAVNTSDLTDDELREQLLVDLRSIEQDFDKLASQTAAGQRAHQTHRVTEYFIGGRDGVRASIKKVERYFESGAS